MTLSLTGVNAGLVVLSADDPGMHSSQNEQDSRAYAKFAKVPMLEPSDSQEAYDFLDEAFRLSEEFDTPVLLRSSTRLSHGRGRVVPRGLVDVPEREYARQCEKYVMIPAYARVRNRSVLERLTGLRRRSEESSLNVLEAGSTDFGIISSGISYAYAREAFPDAWFLKLGMSNPLPYEKIAQLYQHVSRMAVVEDLDAFVEEQVRAMNLPVIGKQALPADGELNQETVFTALEPFLKRSAPRRRRAVIPPAPKLTPAPQPPQLPVRPPVLCPGCSHRSVYAALRRHKLAAMGDIGCYTLGALPPLTALDTCLCMGASVGMMAGFNKALGRKAAVGVIGDSTFFHSGITPLIDALYNQSEGLVLILDNRTTAMTGHQGHPGTGSYPGGDTGPAIDIQRLCEGIGVRCKTVDAQDYGSLDAAIGEEVLTPGLGVVVALAPCALQVREKRGEIVVDGDRCNLCGTCVKIGCPAIVPGEESVTISEACTGCALCVEMCRRGALACHGVNEGEESA
jgi:indolepyruvate ferredoxin oxidoreductase alpha subunit